jgi:hypothetical protein
MNMKRIILISKKELAKYRITSHILLPHLPLMNQVSMTHLPLINQVTMTHTVDEPGTNDTPMVD